MSTHAVVPSRRRSSLAGPVVLLFTLIAAAACDRPEQSEVIAGPQFAPPATSSIVQCSPMNTGGTTKAANVNVKLSTGAAVAGIVVTMVEPMKGPVCAAVTDNNGRARFTHLSTGGNYFLTVRDEVSPYAPAIEIGPADPNTMALMLLYDEPSLPALRQRPTLLSGTACTTQNALTWTGAYLTAYGSPCIVPSTGSPNFDVNVTLSPTNRLDINVVYPDGATEGAALVAAISAPKPDEIDLACSKMPWLDQDDCTDPALFSGPGLLQAMSVTNTGSIGLGVSAGSDPLYIEVTAPQSGFTLFGTAIVYGSTNTATVFLAPGMCSITTVEDAIEPSGFTTLDILRSRHSIGLSTATETATDPLSPMQLVPEYGTIVVQAEIVGYGDGTGRFDLSYRGTSGGNRSVRIPFSVSAGVCAVGDATGSGIGSNGPFAAGYCTQTGEIQDDNGVFRPLYTFYFTTTGLPTLTRAEYTVQAGSPTDNLDPSRSDVTSDTKIARGAIQIAVDELTVQSCDVPKNNDGRFLTL
jgi:hypothetical protein